MKRIYLTTLLVLLISSSAVFAQMKPFKFGLKISPNVGWLSTRSNGYEKDGGGIGYNWGLIGDFTLADNYFLSTGFAVNNLHGKLKYQDSRMVEGASEKVTGSLHRKYSISYVDIPIMLKMCTNRFDNFRYFGQFGPTLGIKIKADAKDEFTTTAKKYFTEENIKKEINSIRGGLILGAGAEYYVDQSTCFFVGLNYSNGFTNVLKDRNPVTDIKPKATLNYFEITFGMIF